MGRKSINDPNDLAQVNVRMTIDFKKQCDNIAEKEGISLNEWIRRAMKDRLSGVIKKLEDRNNRAREELESLYNKMDGDRGNYMKIMGNTNKEINDLTKERDYYKEMLIENGIIIDTALINDKLTDVSDSSKPTINLDKSNDEDDKDKLIKEMMSVNENLENELKELSSEVSIIKKVVFERLINISKKNG